ncbi:MAG: DUF1653 domain-containing protein [Lactobacillaceae bacterium]|nr:DUF1653 domain-containing protein [Lactobacillaceae bacterium]
MEVKVGQHYRHFKGHQYEILHLGTDVDDLKPLVIYRNLNLAEDDRIWVRSLAEFTSLHSSGVARFSLIEE